MTRTDPPDILVSTVYRDINVNSAYSHSLHHPKPCDSQIFEDEQEKHNNLNSAELRCEQKKITTPSMEYAYRRAYRPVAQPDVAWNPVGQQDYHRFSSPDLFNTKLAHQQAGVDVAAEVHRSDVGRNSRSRSAPRVMTTLTPVHFEDSPPTARRGRDVHRVLREPARRLDPSPHREASNIANRTMLNEVHPIKLQPQMGDGKRCSPLYIADGLEENRTNKPATSPHVKCRVDIKPDEAVLRHTARKQSPLRAEVPWQWSRSLSTPRWIVASRTPTPSDSCSVEYRQPYQYASSLPNNYIQPDEMPLHRMPSPMESRAYFGRERRAHSSPNVPARFLYTEDPVRYPPSPAAYYRDHYSIPNPNYSPKVHFVDSRTHTVPMAPSRSYYAELEPYQHPHQAAYPKAYSANEELPYAPTQTCYSDDPKTYHIQTLPPKVFYTGEPLVCRPEHYLSSRAYHTEDRRRPHVSQSYADDWYGSDVSSYTAQPTPLLSQYTLPRARQEATLASSYPNPCMEPSRLGVDARAFSKSWDNILNPHAERQQPVQRGRSYENLLSRDMSTPCPNARRQPVVINLSSSPRRYAALSLSDNSLTDRSPTDGSKNRSWFVTPEITITDNDIRAGNLGKMEAPSASWDALDSGRVPTPHVSYNESTSFSLQSPKEKSQNSSSLQQSLEQLDELLADLYIDYKTPSSRRSSEALLDQLKKLINDEDAANADISAEDSKGSEEGGLLEKQPDVAHASTNNIGKHCGSNERLQKSECSPDQSTDDDETMICSNSRCQRTETVFNACLYYKSCHSCYTYYCSRNCRREDWDVHKENCLYGRISSVCRRVIKFCRETEEVHKAFSRIAKVGYLSRGRGILFLGFPNPGSSSNFLQYGLESLLMSPTYLSLRELDGFKENLGEYCKELQEAGRTYDPSECFLLNVSVALGEHVPGKPSPRGQIPTVRKHAKITLASTSPEKKVIRKESEMETLILTPPPGMADMDKEGEEGRKAREICFINIQRELRTRGVFLRHEYPDIYQQLCEFVESNKRFTPTTIYPIDKRTGKQFMCMIMAGSEPRTLDWLGTPNLLDDII